MSKRCRHNVISVDPDQTAPTGAVSRSSVIWVYTVYPDLLVQILRITTVFIAAFLFNSLTKFVEDADDDCVRIVDGLLDVLTKGQHMITKKQLSMKKMEEEMKAAQAAKEAEMSQNSTQNSLEPVPEDDDVQKRLNKTAELLRDLQQTQYDRLSQKLPSHLGNIQGPSDKEYKIGKILCVSSL